MLEKKLEQLKKIVIFFKKISLYYTVLRAI